jgi:hypothetical protein
MSYEEIIELFETKAAAVGLTFVSADKFQMNQQQVNYPTLLIEPMTSDDIYRTDYEEYQCVAWVAYNLKSNTKINRLITRQTQVRAQNIGKTWLKSVIDASTRAGGTWGIVMTSDKVRITRYDYDYNEGLCGVQMSFSFKVFRDDTIHPY